VIKGDTFVDKDAMHPQKILEDAIEEGVEIRFEFVHFISPAKRWKVEVHHISRLTILNP